MLRIEFQLEEKLREELRKVRNVNALLIDIRREQLHLLSDPIRVDGDASKVLAEVRRRLQAEDSLAAYVVVTLTNPDGFTVISYVSDRTPAKQRMLYSSGLSYLQEQVAQEGGGAPVETAQASEISAIMPSLLRRVITQEERESLMTESERRHAEIARMEVAPQPAGLPGLEVQLPEACQELISKFSKDLVDTLTFHVVNGTVEVDKKITESDARSGGSLAPVRALLPEDSPRFVLTRYTPAEAPREQIVMAYVCPSSCPPKLKMAYASSKAAFMAQLDRLRVRVDKRVESGDVDEFIEDVEAAFVKVDMTVKPRPHAPAPIQSKGHRMLI